MPVLLAIDDDPLIQEAFRFCFAGKDLDLVVAGTGQEGLDLYEQCQPDVVILDVHLPDFSGLELFRRLHELDPRMPVIMVTGKGTAETAIEAMQLGAFDYVVKPFDYDQLTEQVRRAFEISRLMRVPALVVEEGPPPASADLLIGHCPAMQEVYKAIGRVASRDVTVLILGESGTGKELVARAIYHYSKRAKGPFLAINCAAIPEPLLESELFGHEKGSFTGADRKRIGKFEQCNGGTLFLDEIGDMTTLTQTKILRVLQDQQFERVGGSETIKTDVRLIAATNRDLKTLMQKGTFRSDLFYRLNVFSIRLPSLRERPEDVPLLVEHFLQHYNRELGKEVSGVAPETLAILEHYAWPGNVRELQSVLKQALLQASGPVLVPDFLPAALLAEPTPAAPTLAHPKEDLTLVDLTHFIQDRLQQGTSNLHSAVLEVVERHLLLAVLKHTQNNQSAAARILGITRPTLRARLNDLGLAVEREVHSSTVTK